MTDKPKIQKVPAAGFRVGDGPVEFAGDWPGTFFRGDTSAGIAGHLRTIAKRAMSGTLGGADAYLLDLADKFAACNMTRQQGPNPSDRLERGADKA